MRNLTDKYGRLDGDAVRADIADINKSTDAPHREELLNALFEDVRDIARQGGYDDGYDDGHESGYAAASWEDDR